MAAAQKLLIIDDDIDLLEMTARRLKRKGYETITASNLVDAQARFEEAAGAFRGIVCDLFLGSENGISFYEFTKTKGFEGEFVLATGDETGDDRISALRAEPRFSCLQKPFELQTLLEILTRGT